jgi:pyruvate dehydrogenase E2 component (dihydrolipoamide acetyltransferase)
LATNVIMPALGMAQDTGTLVRWLKSEGQPVQKGEPLMEIETDKVTAEVESPASGILSHVTAAVGDEVPVGQAIAMILAPAEVTVAPGKIAPLASAVPSATDPGLPGKARGGVAASPVAQRIAAEYNLDLSLVKPAGGRVEKADVLAYLERRPSSSSGQPVPLLASPMARRLARERGIDITIVNGSGPDGAVLAADIPSSPRSAADSEAAPAPAPAFTPTVSHAWRIMAERTTQTWTSVPHFYLQREVCAGRLVVWRAVAEKRYQQKVTYTDLLLRLVAAALRAHPNVNAAWNSGAVILKEEVNIGLAVATPDGLVVPVMHDVDKLSLGEISRQSKELVERALAARLRLEDVQGGTFTVSNLGMYGVDSFSAILNDGQGALLAVGRIAERVVAVAGAPSVQSMLTLTLTCDHRAVDGARGAQFLRTLAEFIEEPLGLLD